MVQNTASKLHDQAFERIKDMIRSGQWGKEDILPGENRLAEMLGVSRVTVRTALKQLNDAGIIVTRKGKGSKIILDWRDLMEEGGAHKEMLQYRDTFLNSTRARRLIEPMIAREAAREATPEDLYRIEHALHDTQSDASLTPIKGRTSELVDFHTAVWMAAHNPVLLQTWDILTETSASTAMLPLVTPTHRQQQKEEAQKQHQAIFGAIQRGDEDYAQLYMLIHCDWIAETYGKYFDDFLK